jgi:DNA-binding transcriptional ArsR family regulator
LNLYFDVTESNIEPRYRILKYLAEKGRETYRVIGRDLEMAIGSIGGHLSKLLSEQLIEGARQSPTVTAFGRSLLYDYWPDEFAELVVNEVEGLDMVGVYRPQPYDRAVLMMKPASLLTQVGQLQTFFAP